MSLPLEHSIIARSIFSNDVKREVLWNVLEPGDPYDIRNSMISKLPGNKKLFMGDHLELICLLQSAQIERLSDFLDSYRLKLRDIERGHLDRHSYEVQIKQLVQKLQEQDSYKTENSKLKDFLARQTTQIQILKKSTALQPNQIQKITYLINQNQQLRQNNQKYKSQTLTFNARIQALQQARIRQIQDLKRNYARASNQSYDSNAATYRIQNEAQIKQLQFQLKRMRDLIDSKQLQLNKKNYENEVMQKRLIQLTSKGGTHNLVERQMVQYENQIRIFTNQNDKLIISLRDYTNRLAQSESTKNQIIKKLRQLEIVLRQNEAKLRQKQSQLLLAKQQTNRTQQPALQTVPIQEELLKYESRINVLTRQNLQLNHQLRQQVGIQNQLRQEISALTLQKSKITLISQQNNQLKNLSILRNNLQMKVAELENRHVFATQEIERLTRLLNNKDNQLLKIKSVSFQNQSLKTKIREIEYTFKIKYDTDLTRLKTQYDLKIYEISKLTANQLQSKIQAYQTQIANLKQQLRSRDTTEGKYRVRTQELQSHANRIGLELTTKIKQLQANLFSLSKQNQNLSVRTRQFVQVQSKLIQSQNKNSQIERQWQRLAQLLPIRQEEIYRLKARLNQLEGRPPNTYEPNRTLPFYQPITNLRIPNEEIRRNTNQVNLQHSISPNQLLQKLDRLNQIIRNITQERNQFAQEIQNTKQNLTKSFQQNQQLKNKVAQIQQKSAHSTQQYTNKLKNLTADNDNLRRQLNDNLLMLNNYQIQLLRNSNDDQQEMANRLRQQQDLNAQLQQQVQAISQQLKKRNDQFMVLQISYKYLTVQNQTLKKSNQNKGISTKLQTEGSEKKAEQQQSAKKTISQNDDLKIKVSDLQANIARLNQQLFRIRKHVKQITQQNQSLKIKAKQRQQMAATAELQNQSTITNYENSLKLLSQSNQQQQKQIVQKDLLISQKIDELNRLQNKYAHLQKDYQAIKIQLKQLQQTANSNLQADVLRRFQHYDLTISQYTRRLNDSEQRQATINNQYLQAISALNSANNQNQSLKNQIQQLQASVTTYQASANNKQHQLSRLQQENQKLKEQAKTAMQSLKSHLDDSSAIQQERQAQKQRQRLIVEQNEDLKKLLFEKQSQVRSINLQNASLLEEINRITSIYDQDILQARQLNQNLINRLEQARQLTNNQNQPPTQQQSQENARMREIIMSLNEENQGLNNNIIELNAKIHILEQNRLPSAHQDFRSEYDSKSNQIQQKIQVLVQQIQELKQALKIEADNNSRLLNELQSSKEKVAQLQQQIQYYKSNPLNQNASRDQQQKSAYQYQIQAKKRQNQFLKHQLQDQKNISSKLSMQLMFSNQEVARLNQKLAAEQAQNERLRNINQNQQNQIFRLKRQHTQISQTSLIPASETELHPNYTYYQITIDQLKKQNTRLNQYNQQTDIQIQQLKLALQQKQQTLSQLSNNYRALNSEYQTLLSNSFRLDQQAQNTAKGQNDPEKLFLMYKQLQGKNERIIQICEETEKKLTESEIIINNLRQQIQTLEEQLRVKTFEADNILRQFQEYEQSVHYNFENQVSKRTLAFQQELAKLTQQNQYMKKQLKLQSSTSTNDQREEVFTLRQQIDQLNASIKSKQDQNQDLLNRNQRLVEQQQALRRQLQQTNIPTYKNYQQQYKIDDYLNKIRDLQLSLQNRTEELYSTQLKLRELQEKKDHLKEEIRRGTENSKERDYIDPTPKYQQINYNALTVQRDDLLTKIAELQNKVDFANQRYDRLNSQYQQALRQLQDLKRSSKPYEYSDIGRFTAPKFDQSSLNSGKEAAKKHVQEYERSIRKLYDQFERLQGIIDDLRRQKRSLSEKNRILSEQIARLSRQNQQKDDKIKDVCLRLTNQTALEKRVKQDMALASLRRRLKEKEAQGGYRATLSPQI